MESLSQNEDFDIFLKNIGNKLIYQQMNNDDHENQNYLPSIFQKQVSYLFYH
nr:MAG TPA: hypothetical protein [Caudoviricetes sp.]